MITLIVLYADVKFKKDFEGVYFLAFLLDLTIFSLFK